MNKIIKIMFFNIVFCLFFTISCLANTKYIIDSKTYEYKGKNVTVKYNDEKLSFDVAPIIHNDRTLLPIRSLVEKAGGKIEWEEKTKTVTIVLEDKKITMQIGKDVAKVDGKDVKLDVCPCIAYENNDANAGRTVVPIRFVMENLGLEVNWDQETYTVLVKSKPKQEEIPEEKFEFTNTVNSVSYKIEKDKVVIKITTSKPMEYKISNFNNTERTVIDIDAAKFNCSLKEQFVNKGNIQKIRFGQGLEYARIVVDLLDTTVYTVVSNTAKTELSITYRVKTEKINKDEFIVVLDPGHAAGTIGAYYGGIKEQDITADVVEKTLKLFKKNSNIKVYSTQKNQSIPGLQDIANFANNLNADLFVSVHCNAVVDEEGNPVESVTGTETYYIVRTTNFGEDESAISIDMDKEYYGITSKQLAQYIQNGVLEACESKDRYIKERGTLGVLKYTNMPACLCELEFMTCTETLNKLDSEEYKQKCAEGIYNGIMDAIKYMQK